MIDFSDSQGENGLNVLKVGTAVCSQATKAATGANRTSCPDMPFNPKKTKGRVEVWFKPIGADIIESEESAWDFTIELYSLATGQKVGEVTLTNENMTGFTTAGTVDVTCAAATPYLLAYYTVPNGMYAQLKAGTKYHAYIGDDS